MKLTNAVLNLNSFCYYHSFIVYCTLNVIFWFDPKAYKASNTCIYYDLVCVCVIYCV